MNVAVVGQSVNISIDQGESMIFHVAIPMDLTSYRIRSQIAFHPGAPILLTDQNNGIKNIVISGGNTAFDMVLTTAQTVSLPTNTYPFDLWIVAPSGEAVPIFPGQILLGQRITPLS